MHLPPLSLTPLTCARVLSRSLCGLQLAHGDSSVQRKYDPEIYLLQRGVQRVPVYGSEANQRVHTVAVQHRCRCNPLVFFLACTSPFPCVHFFFVLFLLGGNGGGGGVHVPW